MDGIFFFQMATQFAIYWPFVEEFTSRLYFVPMVYLFILQLLVYFKSGDIKSCKG